MKVTSTEACHKHESIRHESRQPSRIFLTLARDKVGVSSPISDLTERLLLDDKDSPATLQEPLLKMPPFDEVDIQALAHSVQVTRQGVVDSLRFAKGDLFQAFKNEICRMRSNIAIFDPVAPS